MIASEIVNRVRGILLDPAPAQYWTDAELLDYLNAALSALVSIRPSATITTTTFTLTVSTPLQQIPTIAQQFMGLTRNLTPGTKVITQTDKRHLDAFDPAWPATTTSTAIEHFMVYDDDPKFFWVYPIPTGTMTVEMRYSANPTRLTAVGDTVPVDEIYETALQAYVLSMAYSRNSKRGDISKADYYMKASINSLGIKDQSEMKRYVKFTDDTAVA